MADREVQVPADQNIQAAQAAAVLNQPPPPPAQNPEEPPANPQNAAAEEVCLIFLFFVLALFCFASTCCLHRRFSSFSPRVVMPCFVTHSFIVTVLRTPLFYSQVYFLPLMYTAYFFVKLNSSTFYPACLKTCCFVALEAILDYKTCSFEGNSSLFPARVMPCFTTRVAFSLCGQSYSTLLTVHFHVNMPCC